MFARELGIVVGAQVRVLRRRRGLTQSELAMRVNLDRWSLERVEREHIGRLERGALMASLTLLHRIARALDTDLKAMLACIDGMHP